MPFLAVIVMSISMFIMQLCALSCCCSQKLAPHSSPDQFSVVVSTHILPALAASLVLSQAADLVFLGHFADISGAPGGGGGAPGDGGGGHDCFGHAGGSGSLPASCALMPTSAAQHALETPAASHAATVSNAPSAAFCHLLGSSTWGGFKHVSQHMLWPLASRGTEARALRMHWHLPSPELPQLELEPKDVPEKPAHAPVLVLHSCCGMHLVVSSAFTLTSFAFMAANVAGRIGQTPILRNAAHDLTLPCEAFSTSASGVSETHLAGGAGAALEQVLQQTDSICLQ